MNRFNKFMEIEIQLFREINSLAGRFEFIDGLMIMLSSPKTWVVVGLSAFVMMAFKRSEWLMGIFLSALITLSFADLTSFRVIKPLIARERPCRMLDDVQLILNHCGGSYGFTSNHAANAFAVWAIVAINFGIRSTWSLIGITLASAVGISRVYLGVHFWGDVLGGAVIGAIVALLLTRLGLHAVCANMSRRLISYLPSPGK